MEEKKNILTYQGLKKLEDELQELKVVKRKEVAQKDFGEVRLAEKSEPTAGEEMRERQIRI